MAPKRRQLVELVTLSAILALAVSCTREDRRFQPSAPSAEAIQFTRMTDLRAGGPSISENQPSPAMSADETPEEKKFEENAYMVGEGKRLYSAFNCVGCHAHGGGGMGPPLIDDQWIYGHQPAQIFRTIIEGRPNGMPSFGGKIPSFQVWQLAAYVRSLGGLVPGDAAPGRDDDLHAGPPENSAPNQKPEDSSLPKSAEAPK
jgi:cytochrome c oxidase cbb3-type subunit 3